MLRHRGREYRMGDVVWTVDPFERGTDVARMFAIVSTRTHPFGGEQFVGASVTTTDHQVAHPLRESYWSYGGTPEQSYLLPLSIHTPRASNIQAPSEYDGIADPWQGRLSQAFMERVVEEIVWTLRKYE
jgi:hypothetical protein